LNSTTEHHLSENNKKSTLRQGHNTTKTNKTATFQNTYKSIPAMKKAWLVCCQIISLIICFLATTASLFSFVLSSWEIATLEDGRQIQIGLWSVARVNTNSTTLAYFGYWLPTKKPIDLPEAVYIGRFLMTIGLVMGFLGFATGTLGSALICCKKSWISTCTIQTICCIFMTSSTCFLGAMAIVFPFLFQKPEQVKNHKTEAYNIILQQEIEAGLPLAWSYGLSLYLCWAAMVLSGVATAIYAFSTCLLCAEFKLARERSNFNNSFARYTNSEVISYSKSNSAPSFAERKIKSMKEREPTNNYLATSYTLPAPNRAKNENQFFTPQVENKRHKLLETDGTPKKHSVV